MPVEARWFVKTSLLCLVASSMLGTMQFGWGALFGTPAPAWVRPFHLHLATVGWLINMVFGVALWMFPMPRGAVREGRPRYSKGAAIACFAAINGGLALRLAAEPLGNASLGLACGALQTLGIVLGVSMLWPRIRAITLATETAR